MEDQQILRLTAAQYYELSDSEFRKSYESEIFQNILDFLETRIRLEIIGIIRRFGLKGDVLFEIRQKTSASAYSKLQKQIIKKQSEFGDRELYIFDAVKDLIGVRLICMNGEVEKNIFNHILHVESLEVQAEGLEYYSAPFREYTLSKDIHDDLSSIIAKLNSSSIKKRKVEKKSKTSNYESLHFYVKFASKVDNFLLHGLAAGGAWVSESERIRDGAESEYLLELYEEKFGDFEKSLLGIFPIEFQIRTITDHLWAQEEHRFVYKDVSAGPFSTEARDRIDVLKGAFTGLKFAYYNVDRLRSLIRNVNKEKDIPPPSYTGRSKDINSIRFRFFHPSEEDAEARFRYVEKIFQEHGQDIAADLVVSEILKLYDLIDQSKEIQEAKSRKPFDTKLWGKERLFYLFLAYVALFSKTKSLPKSVAVSLNKKLDLVDLVGEAAFMTSVDDPQGCLKLASKIYERVETFDHIARSLVLSKENERTADDRIFWDPLVGIRLASSFFLQNEFSGARRALMDVFKLGEASDYVSWHAHPLSKDFQISEILMRFSQYIFFRSFGNEDRLLNSFQELVLVFNAMFNNNEKEYKYETYRSYSWYYALLNFLYTQDTLLPVELEVHKLRCRTYLKDHLNAAQTSPAFQKPEVQLMLVYLPIHTADHDDREHQVVDNHARFKQEIVEHRSYPQVAVTYMVRMADRLRRRALDKIRRDPNITFLSYARKDKELAESVALHLRELDVNIIYDEDFDRGGEGVYSQIEKAMADSTSAILLVTTEYLKSSWATEERSFLMDKRRRKELRLYVLVEGVTDDELRSKAPLLSTLVYYSGKKDQLKNSLDKIAADIRRPIQRKS
ncbi:toll/interleukin-1 receptor domain-containing protein [Rhizobium sp. FY34]|uniref:toll/interleukin-1 receptor domain-containing protein n=1 Tax=Rhizobium sp. FY34 TaxID=2562309 RepID=UPI0010BFA35D|nr:toll/interleukin-1 receptor domain-containing protein [Rhizobium sp. FY34]